MLQSSNLFDKLVQEIAPRAKYNILGKDYDTGYYLADGIYLKWSSLVQTYLNTKIQRNNTLQPYKKDIKKMWSGHLESSSTLCLSQGTNTFLG